MEMIIPVVGGVTFLALWFFVIFYCLHGIKKRQGSRSKFMMGIKEQKNKPNKKVLIAVIAGYIFASCIWIFCLFVMILGLGKGEIGYFLAVGYFIAWPVLFMFFVPFFRIFLPMIKK